MATGLENVLGIGAEDEVDEVEETEQVDDTNEEDDVQLGPGGEKALRAERKRVRELERELSKLKAKPAPKTEDQIDPDEFRAQVRQELAHEFGLEVAREKAVNTLQELGYRGNPERGAKQLDLASVLDENGKVDAKALRDAVEDWKEDEPQLFKRSRTPATEEEDDDEDVAPRARRRNSGSLDLGKRKAQVDDEDPLAKALGNLVGRDKNRLV